MTFIISISSDVFPVKSASDTFLANDKKNKIFNATLIYTKTIYLELDTFEVEGISDLVLNDVEYGECLLSCERDLDLNEKLSAISFLHKRSHI